MGRPKGSLNGVTYDARAKMSEVLSLALAEISKRIENMDNSELIEATALLSKHTVPVPKEDNGDGTTDTKLQITIKPDDLQ